MSPPMPVVAADVLSRILKTSAALGQAKRGNSSLVLHTAATLCHHDHNPIETLLYNVRVLGKYNLPGLAVTTSELDHIQP